MPTISADDLNTYFVSVGPRVTGEIAGLGDVPEVACRLPRVGACALQLSPLSLGELRAIVFGLSSSSACGDDGISIHMFRMSFDSIGEVRYCLSVYGGTSKENLCRVQKVLNYAAKVVFGRRKYDHASDLLRRLEWFSADQLVSYHTLSLLHKVRRSGEPEELAAGLATVAEARGRDRDVVTRQDHLLHVPRCRTEMGRRRFQCRGPAAYNALPPDLLRLPPHLFGCRLRRHLRVGTDLRRD
ncbi:hypothetical protein FJT64_000055 [Amphibalanus amphitrite]|uniref:Uncharacterized protein n=1 Tax=Amphibalanus amphitrite TaxID=1232801 RepID=A0A6A4XBI4_AMPAM|nr:hypothetical protein FJT64_000055 [Amphibalanus amphitrite]